MTEVTKEVQPLTPEEAAELEEESVERSPDGTPSWASMPPERDRLKYPPGVQLTFMRFRPEWTAAPGKGERQCILWELNVGDEKVAAARGGEDSRSVTMELAKQTIRVVDGHWANYGVPNDPVAGIDVFWQEIGYRCRALIINHFAKTHSLSSAEKMDFLGYCVGVRIPSR